MKGYYFITDAVLSRAGNVADMTAAVAAGVVLAQYRCKNGSSRILCDEARALRGLCQGTSTAFIVNDRVDIAVASAADGVHLGQDDLPVAVARAMLGHGKIIGVTVHDLAEARQAVADGADYLGVSPVFATATKADAGPAGGLELLRTIRAAITGLPLVAIGGITLANAPDVIAAGADMVCAISAVVCAADPGAQMARFQALFSH